MIEFYCVSQVQQSLSTRKLAVIDFVSLPIPNKQGIHLAVNSIVIRRKITDFGPTRDKGHFTPINFTEMLLYSSAQNLPQRSMSSSSCRNSRCAVRLHCGRHKGQHAVLLACRSMCRAAGLEIDALRGRHGGQRAAWPRWRSMHSASGMKVHVLCCKHRAKCAMLLAWTQPSRSSTEVNVLSGCTAGVEVYELSVLHVG